MIARYVVVVAIAFSAACAGAPAATPISPTSTSTPIRSVTAVPQSAGRASALSSPSVTPPVDPRAATPAPPATAVRSVVPTSPVAVQARLTDALRIEPATMTARIGEAVTFAVTNEGGLIHEFYLGDAEAQVAHEAEVVASGLEPPVDGPNGIAVEPGQTEQLTFVFTSAGEWIAGCHVRNHYSGGMKATITVTE